MKKIITGFIRFCLKWMILVCYTGIFLVLAICVPFFAGYRPTIILSGSMEPAIMTGDIVYVSEVNRFEDLKPGDVIAFQRQEDATPVTHRIVELNEAQKTVTTKGDNNNSEDTGMVTYTQVKGKVAGFRIPKVGYAIHYLKQPMVLGGLVLVIVIHYIWENNSIEDNKKSKRKKEKEG